MSKTGQPKSAENLAETLAAGNFTANGQIIKALNGNSELNLRVGADDIFHLLNDTGFNKAYLYGTGTIIQTGFGFNYWNESGATFTQFRGAGSFFHANDVKSGLADVTTLFGTIVAAMFIIDNSLLDRAQTSAGIKALFLNSGGANDTTFKAGIANSIALGGDGLTIKTANTAYANQICLQAATILLDSIIKSGTLTADRTLTTPDKSGEIGLANEYAEMYFQNNASATVLTLNTPVKINATYVVGENSALFSVSTAGVITYIGTENACFKPTATLSGTKVGLGTIDCNFSFALNGVVVAKTKIMRQMGPIESTVPLQGLLQLVTNDTIEIFMENITDSDNALILNANVILVLAC